MEILDPDLWNDDGTPKRPTADYMKRLSEAQAGDPLIGAVDVTVPLENGFLNYARIKRDAKAQRAPEVGDIAHFFDVRSATCRAAIVMETSSFEHDAWLRVHIPNEPFEDWQAEHDEAKGPNSWHWPCGEGQ